MTITIITMISNTILAETMADKMSIVKLPWFTMVIVNPWSSLNDERFSSTKPLLSSLVDHGFNHYDEVPLPLLITNYIIM